MFCVGVSFEMLFALEEPGRVSTADFSSDRQKSGIVTLSRQVPASSYDPYPIPQQIRDVDLLAQTPEQAALKSRSCIACHKTVTDPHDKADSISLGCTDCHGGNASESNQRLAHIHPRFPDVWKTSANPVRTATLLNHERPEFIRFVNPGDLRVAHLSCGRCHGNETLQVKKSMMTHGCMLWGAALYNNGAIPFKWPRYGESYSMDGTPQRLQTVPPPTQEEMEKKGVLPYLEPLPPYQITQPGNILRIFERGGRFFIEPGIPERFEEPGRPRNRLSNRGLGTLNRTDPVFIGVQKTRLLDPTLNFLGTNDHPGDYRSSGCTACHFVYANDRSPVHSGPYARYGNKGFAASKVDFNKIYKDGSRGLIESVDPTIPKDEPGHPIQHKFTTSVPTSQCMVCHIHPGTNVLNSYLGYTWWDQETDGELMYPAKQKYPTTEEYIQAQMSNPNEIAVRGKWSDPDFLERVSELNPQLRHTQFADFHGHGWVFRAVFKKNREGDVLDYRGRIVRNPTAQDRQKALLIPQYTKQLYRNRDWDLQHQDPNSLSPSQQAKLARVMEMEQNLEKYREDIPVHMMDIHLEKGMHCVDCHFVQDVHGNTKLYGEVRAAIEIRCVDCHGTIRRHAYEIPGAAFPMMRTSGPAATENVKGDPSKNGNNLTAMRTPFGKRRFEIRGDRVVLNSMIEPNLSWEITQVKDTIDPTHRKYNPLSAISKTVRFQKNGRFTWGDVPGDDAQCAHGNRQMSCTACHTSWNPSCFGCHLPQKANRKTPDLHNEGDVTRNYTSYNFQTLKDDVYMLAKDGNVTGNRINPARSSCAIHVSSYNANRESIYVQQQTISADGMSGIAFSTNVPHTVRARGETKMCSDCHLSQQNDNNAIMAQLLMQGTNYMNWIGKYCWIAGGKHGLHAAVVTEGAEPQAVIGSFLHKLAYPDYYRDHLQNKRILEHGHEHPGYDVVEKVFRPHKMPKILNVQLRGEYVYAACGKAGLRIFDVAFIDHKGFSERIVTAPVSPVGQKFYVRTSFATDVASPTTIVPDPTRTGRMPENHEAAVHPMYAYIYVTDLYEGLILVGAGSLLDGNPKNNFVKRDVTFNPDGILDGARKITIAGTYAYICCNAGLVVVSLEDPLHLKVTSVLGNDFLNSPSAVAVQFRYAFVCDADGLKVLDVTDLAQPKPVAALELPEAHNIYVARTYAYIAGGKHGLIIVDVKNPTQPKVDAYYDAHGVINDLHDVKLGVTYVSEFAYLADGCNGLRVVQLTSPETRGHYGFSPRPTPQLIATYTLPEGGHALAISKGVDRDRAVDESGNQIAVFGRVGARPFNLEEQQKLFRHPSRGIWKVIDGQRNYEIPSVLHREDDLYLQLSKFYGPSRLPPGQNRLNVTRKPFTGRILPSSFSAPVLRSVPKKTPYLFRDQQPADRTRRLDAIGNSHR
ncbi:MAG: hypothetical protein IID46_00835 [Planctomycetes bacterium]|nr:hypothetical protein [Planctomycetota bacterium]